MRSLRSSGLTLSKEKSWSVGANVVIPWSLITNAKDFKFSADFPDIFLPSVLTW
jgi:hypothetical protein